MRFNSSSSVVTARVTPRRFARSVAIILSVCAMLTLAVSSAPVASAAASPAGIDLVVTAVSPTSAVTGANVVPTATVKNQGTVKTPAGTILDVAFVVEGTTVWSDTKTTSLAPGASVTLSTNKLVGTIAASTPKSDLVVTSVSPSTAVTGSNVVPSATVKNQGAAATPAGTILDVAFVVEGTTLWSDTKTT